MTLTMPPARKRKKMSPPSPQETGILDLPNELLETIFLKLSQEDIQQNVALVCRRFLEITRNPKFVQNLKIKLRPDENDFRRLKKSCLERAQKVLKIYPQCQIELYHQTYGADCGGNLINEIFGYSWMGYLHPFASSITKMTLAVTHGYVEDFSDFIEFENLEYLDLTISAPDDHDEDVDDYELVGPQDLGADFWNNFPKLKFLSFRNWDARKDHVSSHLTAMRYHFVHSKVQIT